MENTTILLQRVEHAGLAEIIGQAVGTVRRWQSSEPWRLPPYIQIGRKKFYLLETVVEWMRAQQQQPQERPQTQPKPIPIPACVSAGTARRGRGRPRKVASRVTTGDATT